ncbi:MAG: membrane dipeptidase [Caldilineaceae bacterium]
MNNPPIFDGHNDTVLALCAAEPDKRRDFFTQSEQGHIDFPRPRPADWPAASLPCIRAAGAAGQFSGKQCKEDGSYEIPLPTPPEQSDALKATVSMAAKLLSVEKQAQGQIKIVRTADELAHCLANGIFAMLLHIEGAEAIDTDFEALHVFYEMGLRSIGPVWSRPNAFGYGVPFKYPATPDIGPGLTDAGKALVRECNQLGVLIDLSHLNEKGFWDVARLSDAPLVATHSNAHALSATSRNLTDKQLDALAESNGVAGMNYHIGFLREDGRSDKETSLAEIAPRRLHCRAHRRGSRGAGL